MRQEVVWGRMVSGRLKFLDIGCNRMEERLEAGIGVQEARDFLLQIWLRAECFGDDELRHQELIVEIKAHNSLSQCLLG